MPRNKRKLNKQILINTFGKKCQICGYDDCPAALEFHHLNPKNKEFNISKIAGKNTLSYKDIQEICGCILVCANCHREIHSGMLENKMKEIIPIDIVDFLS